MAKALRRAGATVVSVEDPSTYLHRTPRLARGTLRARPDLLLVGFPGHADVPVARLVGLRRRVPVIFDAFVSLYETDVEDRQLTRPGSVRARRYALEDRIACLLANRVLLDTDTHADYFTEQVGVPRHKVRRIWVGADDEVMHPRPWRDESPPDASVFKVFVYGSFVPLQGIEHIVRAASELERRGEQVRVEIVGSGQTEADCRSPGVDGREPRVLGHLRHIGEGSAGNSQQGLRRSGGRTRCHHC
jgi:glycosyltransferase involved in cell wall biosynthesis